MVLHALDLIQFVDENSPDMFETLPVAAASWPVNVIAPALAIPECLPDAEGCTNVAGAFAAFRAPCKRSDVKNSPRS